MKRNVAICTVLESGFFEPRLRNSVLSKIYMWEIKVDDIQNDRGHQDQASQSQVFPQKKNRNHQTIKYRI